MSRIAVCAIIFDENEKIRRPGLGFDYFCRRKRQIYGPGIGHGQVRAKVNGEPIPSLSELAQQLPLVLLDTEGLTLLTGTPDGRRRLLDGTLFHVEQAFLAVWKRYAQSLRQRNSGLRHGILTSDEAWRRELAETGEKLTAARLEVVARYSEKLSGLAPALSPDLSQVEMAFRAGWDRRNFRRSHVTNLPEIPRKG